MGIENLSEFRFLCIPSMIKVNSIDNYFRHICSLQNFYGELRLNDFPIMTIHDFIVEMKECDGSRHFVLHHRMMKMRKSMN